MTIIVAQNRSSTILQIGGVLTINATVGAGYITRRAMPLGSGPATTTQFTGSALTFGPYDEIAAFTMACDTGVMDYSTTTPVRTLNNSYSARYSKTIGPNGATTIRIPAGSRMTISGTGNATFFDVSGLTQPISYTGVSQVIESTVSDRIYKVLSTTGDVTVATAWSGGAAKTVWRAAGTRVQLPYLTSGASTGQSFGWRINVYEPIAIKRFYVVWPTFHVDESNGSEVDLVQDARMQVGVDEFNTQSMNNLPVRGIVRWNGAPTTSYSKTNGPFAGMVSDVYEMSQPRNMFSLYSVKEWVGTPPNNMSPRNCNLSNVAGKYEKSEIFTVASGVSPIDTGWAITQTDIGSETLFSSGRLGFCPFIVAELVDGTVSVIILGTSSARGVNETSGPVTDNNQYGDIHGSRGWCSRWIGTTLGLPYANFGISGDQLGIMLAGNNFQRRLALAKMLNPSHCLFQHGANDIAGGATVATTITRAVQVMDKLRSVLPNLQFVPCGIQPSSTSSNNWTAIDGSDQTQNTAFNNNGAALQYETLQRTGQYPWDGTYGKKGVYIETTLPLVNPIRNPNPLVACDYTFYATGTANDQTIDGRHLNTNAIYRKLIPSLPSISPFGF